jgi:hypothetical protein
MDLKETGLESADCIRMTLDTVHWACSEHTAFTRSV